MIAQSPEAVTHWHDWVTNLSAVGVLCALVWWLMTRGIPRLFEKWDETLKGQRADFIGKLTEGEERFIKALDTQAHHYDKWKEDSKLIGEQHDKATQDLKEATLKLHQSLEDLPGRLSDTVEAAIFRTRGNVRSTDEQDS